MSDYFGILTSSQLNYKRHHLGPLEDKCLEENCSDSNNDDKVDDMNGDCYTHIETSNA